MRAIIATIGLMAFLVLNGCAQIKLTCPATGPQMTASVNGPDTVGAISALLSLAIKAAPVFAANAAATVPAQPASGGTLTYSTLAFTSGTQTVSCGPQPLAK